MTKRSLTIVVSAVVISATIWVVMLLTISAHKTLDQQVSDVASQLKCPVCQSESVADSPAAFAQQMRGVIRSQLQSGQSEQQVIQYFVDRYGTQILWSPAWQGFSLLAWLVPIGLLLGGAVFLFFTLRRWRTQPSIMARAGSSIVIEADEAELEPYRTQFERELAADDPLFGQRGTEAR